MKTGGEKSGKGNWAMNQIAILTIKNVTNRDRNQLKGNSV